MFIPSGYATIALGLKAGFESPLIRSIDHAGWDCPWKANISDVDKSFEALYSVGRCRMYWR